MRNSENKSEIHIAPDSNESDAPRSIANPTTNIGTYLLRAMGSAALLVAGIKGLVVLETSYIDMHRLHPSDEQLITAFIVILGIWITSILSLQWGTKYIFDNNELSGSATGIFGTLCTLAIFTAIVPILFGITALMSIAEWLMDYVMLLIKSGIFGYIIGIIIYVAISAVSIWSAFIMYTLRSQNRILYGKIEVMFGILAIIYYMKANFSWIIYLNSDTNSGHGASVNYLALQLFAGIYIIVRGITNIEDGLDCGHLPLRRLISIFMKDVSIQVIWQHIISFFRAVRSRVIKVTAK
jgi:hypothetical protein